MIQVQKRIEELADKLDRETFEKFTTPEELHYLAQNWPWETTEEIQIIRWICESDLCSQATALMLFWYAQPQDYTCYKLGAKIPYSNDIFALIQLILFRFEKEAYHLYAIHYDPHHDMPTEKVEIDRKMKKAICGETTWYEEDYIKEISWYTPSELEREIRCCTDRHYLHMAANGLLQFRDADHAARLIMENPHCDKGTALLLYWRLLLFYSMRGFSPSETEETFAVVQQIHEKLLSDSFSEGIAYAPLKDKENAKLLGKQKNKWEIPQRMKQGV